MNWFFYNVSLRTWQRGTRGQALQNRLRYQIRDDRTPAYLFTWTTNLNTPTVAELEHWYRLEAPK